MCRCTPGGYFRGELRYLTFNDHLKIGSKDFWELKRRRTPNEHLIGGGGGDNDVAGLGQWSIIDVGWAVRYKNEHHASEFYLIPRLTSPLLLLFFLATKYLLAL